MRNKSGFGVLLIMLSLTCTCCDLDIIFGEDKHKQLLSFDYKYLRDFTDKESRNYETVFGEEKITKKQIGDTLAVTVDLPWNGCASIDGNVRVNKDSLVLQYWLTDDELCSELVHYRLRYKILNKPKRKYKVGFEFKENE